MSGILIEGERGVGKSHLLHQVLAKSSKNYGGYYVQRVTYRGNPYGYAVQKLSPAEPVKLTVEYNTIDAESLFIYAEGETRVVKQHHFEMIAIQALVDCLERQVSVAVLDELGGVELLSENFCKVLYQVLDSKSVVGTFKQDDNISEIQKRAGLNEKLLINQRQLLRKNLCQNEIQVVSMSQANKAKIMQLLSEYLE